MSAWYAAPLVNRVARRTTLAEFDAALDRIAAFEQTLAADGALVLKFWMHVSRRDQKRRLQKLSQGPADPVARDEDAVETAPPVRPVDARPPSVLIQRTSFGHAPWFIIDAADERYRNLAVATEIRDALFRIARDRARRPSRPRATPADERRGARGTRRRRPGARLARRPGALGARRAGHDARRCRRARSRPGCCSSRGGCTSCSARHRSGDAR